MTKAEMRLLFKIIDIHTEEYEPFPNAPKAKIIPEVDKFKNFIRETFEVEG